MSKIKKIVLSFDLDFTLIDNREGIVNSFNHSLKKFNLPPVNYVDIETMIGIPLGEMFAKYSKFDSFMLSNTFRKYYKVRGIYQAHLFPGAIGKLEELKQALFTLGIITSKKREIAIKITKYLRIHDYFDFILGETENIKSKLDPKLKDILFTKYPDYNFIVIGDHPIDGMLAKNLNCPFIGVLTGTHNAKELMDVNNFKSLILNSIAEITEQIIYSLL